MRLRLQRSLVVVGVVLAGAAAWVHYLPAGDSQDPFQLPSYLRSLEPALLLGCGLSLAAAALAPFRRARGGGPRVALALALVMCGAFPLASRRFTQMRAEARQNEQRRVEAEKRRQAEREAQEALAAAAQVREAARLAALPVPVSSNQPCELGARPCPDNEICFAVSGDYGLGPRGPVVASGGDHRCHSKCDHHPCTAPETCQSVLLRAADTGGTQAWLCLAPRPVHAPGFAPEFDRPPGH